MNVEKLKDLKDKIELLSKSYQIEIGRLLKKNNININENKNGVFINLSSVDETIITELENFLNYANNQELQLKNIEIKQEELKDYYFNNNNNEILTKGNEL
tara:strand:- start:3619 stop:3921 length:303 start_codon:yes stop_codon:yes gene_type:complete